MVWILIIVGVLVCIVAHDVLQKRHTILHNFPLVGHLRYLLEKIGPELRQYWVANDKEELPFSRSERAWVYASAKGQNNSFGFGTNEQIYAVGYPILKHAVFPFDSEDATVPPGGDESSIPCAKIMGARHNRKRQWRPASVINISAMSYGSLGRNAISALNRGAAKAGCYHNTGEGGVSPYHLLGADVMWQLGTGYYGARRPDGGLDMDKLVATVKANPRIRAIEIKLSQGAKPGKGGILPAAKVTPEIAKIRGIPEFTACLSPNTHRAFSNVEEMIDLIEEIAEKTGLPVGIKSAIGKLDFWYALADQMRVRRQGPDFIAIDGGEGGTGAAPLAFADHVSLPFKLGFARVFPLFQDAGISEEIVWIGSGKLGFPDRAVIGFAMGCDLIAVARESMLAIGCIQAMKCHDGHCPTGIATHNKWLQAGLNVDDKGERFSRYVKMFRKELLALSHASGYQHPAQFTGTDVEFSTGVNAFTSLQEVIGYVPDAVPFTTMAALGQVSEAA